MPFISGEQGNKGQFFRGTGEQRQYWGTGNIENEFSIFEEQGNKPIYFRGIGAPWEILKNYPKQCVRHFEIDIPFHCVQS